jgi:hypothetical protein
MEQVLVCSEAHVVAALALADDFSVAVHVASSPGWVYVSPASYWHVIDTFMGECLCFTDYHPPLNT